MKPWLACLFLLITLTARGESGDYALQAQQVAPDVYVFVGRTEDFSLANGGNIVNTGFIVGTDGLVVIDSGPSLRYGQAMRQAMAAISPLPVVLVINTHHHPDHFLGNQAFERAHLAALPGTIEGIAQDGNAFAENLFRLTGDWMKGTEVVVPSQVLAPGALSVAGRRLQLQALSGHTGTDLAVYDEKSGVLFTGDLVFNQRAPTTPHADMAQWLTALTTLTAWTRQAGFSRLVPGHGPVAMDAAPIVATRAWLQWLQATMRDAARAGLDMTELLARPLPAEFATLPVAASEYRRSVSHLFPAAEQAVLEAGH